MNTKIIMVSAAILLGIGGILLTFFPMEILDFLELEPTKMQQLILQLVGALYFAFAMLNWMSKSGLIGGIYNRPICVANFSHFTIAGIAFLKTVFGAETIPYLWILVVVYASFALIFGVLLFRHPLPEDVKNSGK